MSKRGWGITGIIFGVILIVGAASYYTWGAFTGEPVTWDLTLTGNNNQQVLSYEELRRLPAQKGEGGFFTTVGVVNGPFEVKGVPLYDLCALVGGVTPEDIVMISARDGYSMVFDYDQLGGDIDTFDPANLREVPHSNLIVLLAYEQDGKPLAEIDGMPLRIAIVGTEPLLTEGHNWVKWVNKIEVLRLE